MSSATRGNADWRALSDEAKSPVDDTSGEYDDLWGLLTVRQQQAVARGEISLEALADKLTEASDEDLCPRCCKRPIMNARYGLCRVCARTELNIALGVVAKEMEVQLEADALKQQVHRRRESLGLRRPRQHDCAGCGEPLPPRASYNLDRCPECLERDARRGRARVTEHVA